MSQYYYTVASLPMLFYEEDASVSHSEFIQMCETGLTPRDYSVLKAANLCDLEDIEPSCPALEEWRSWERSLRNKIAILRAQRKGLEPEKHLREGTETVGVEQIAHEACGQDSPLVGEDVLNRARWSFLDDLETGHHFDTAKLVAYSLKLQILERKALFDEEKGTGRFESIVKTLSG